MNRIEFLANLDKYKGEDHSAFLQHYGILGQKWGQRRWQNADGTFNTEGKIRYFGSQKAQAEQNTGLALDVVLPLALISLWDVGVVTSAVAGPTIHDAGVSKKIRKYEENFEKEETDEKSGLKLKNKTDDDYSNIKKALKDDMNKVNMEYHYINDKKHGDEKDGTKHNCMLCTTAMDMRRRGYDVRAGKNEQGYRFNDVLPKWYKNAKVESGTFKEIFSKLKQEPNGSYGNLRVTWKEQYGGAHSVFYYIKDGKPLIYDCQSGNTWKEDELKMIASSMKDNTGYCRTDNLEPNIEYMKKEGLIRYNLDD